MNLYEAGYFLQLTFGQGISGIFIIQKEKPSLEDNVRHGAPSK